MVGSLNVGKTSLLTQYAIGESSLKTENSENASYLSKIRKLNGFNFEIKLWDTAGQEKYKSLTKLFLKDAKIAILVYSIDNKESFKELDFWLDLIKSMNDETVLYGVCANKSDLASEKTIPEEKGKEYAKKIGAEWISTSAKIKEKGIEKFIEMLFIKYYRKYFVLARSGRDSLNSLNSQNTLNRGFYQEKKIKKGCCQNLVNNKIIKKK